MHDAATPVYVTQPHLPPLAEFLPYLEEIWKNKWLTNNGPFHQQLEETLARHLGVSHLSLFSNGTIALVVALQSLRISGEVITTPFSFVATAHSLLWNGIKPVFVDIDPVSLNLDPSKIEAAITPQTTAILPVHCYGRPCDTQSISRIADRYGLRVIYDAAHAFGVRHEGVPVASEGELSVLSFHATKVFTTFEGGAIISPDLKSKQRIDYLKNFGIADEITVVGPGINGKMNEVQAAFGLLQLRYLAEALEVRRTVDAYYRTRLKGIRGLKMLTEPTNTDGNFSYFPILVGPEYPLRRDELYERMRGHGVFVRRYFYPLISEMPMYRGLSSSHPANLPVATRIAQQVLCLPIHAELSVDDLTRVVDLLINP